MLSRTLSEKILTVGCRYNPPKGGIAQVINTYAEYIYPHFNVVENSVETCRLGKLIFSLWAIIRYVIVLLFNRNIKIVHIHSASYNSFIRSSFYAFIGKLFGKKIVFHMHGGAFMDYYKRKTNYVKRKFKWVDAVIALSDSWQKFYEKEVGVTNVYVVQNVISPPLVVKESRKNDGLIHLLFLGLITEQKGIFDLLDLLKSHRKEFEGKIILHIGGKGDVKRLKNIIEDDNMQDIVSFEGWVQGEKKNMLYSSSDIFVLPSYVEGVPITILEAMSYQLPIIATNIGGIPSVVEHNHNGYLFTPGDMKSLYELLQCLIDNKELRLTMGKRSYERIGPFLPENVENQLQDIYLRLLN